MNNIERITLLVLFIILISTCINIFTEELVNADSFLSQIPTGIALTNAEDVTEDASGNIYAVVNHNVKKLTSDGKLLLEFGSFGSADGQFSYPQGIALDSSGNIYVADTDNHRIQVFGTSVVISPTFTAIRTGLDTIVLTFSENVDVTTTNGAGYTLSTGTVTANTDPAGTSNIITLTTSGITGTSATPTVTYGASAGTTVGLTANEVVNGANTMASDAVPPTFTAIRTSPITWIITFSENVDASANENSAWTISGGHVVTAVSDPANTKTLTITTAASTDTTIGQTITYIAAGGTVADTVANEVANGTSTTVSSYENTSLVFGTIFIDINGDGIQSLGESGIAARTVILVDGNGTRLADKTTNVNGTYNFTGVAPGTLLVQTAPVPQNHLPSTGFFSYARPTTVAGFTTTVNFPLTFITPPNRATVNGTVFEDTNNNGVQDGIEPGLLGVQVFVVDFLTLTQTTVFTDANGVYNAAGILPDVVLVQASPIPAGHLPHTTTYSYQTLPQGSTTTVNFALKPVAPIETGTIVFDVFNDVNTDGIKNNGETGVSGARVFTFELLTAQPDAQFTNSTGSSTHSGLIPDVVLAQINADPFYMPPGFTTITSPNGGFQYVSVISGSTTTVKIGLH